jgi:hypothetical protein
MRKLLLGLVVATTALTFLSSVSAQASSSSRLTSTTVRHISPLDSSGHLKSTYTLANVRRGRCFTTSFENGRLFRCLGGNFLHDPCWKESGRHSVVCVDRPWSHRVTRLNLTRPLPARNSFGPTDWGLRLASGIDVKCQHSQGASGTVGGKPISYFCGHGWVLLGNHPNRSQPVWTMATAKSVNGHYQARGRKNLSEAWRAVKL